MTMIKKRFLLSSLCGLLFFSTLAQRESSSLVEQALLSLYSNKQYAEVVAAVDSILAAGDQHNLARMYQIKADALYFLNDLPRSLENYLLTIESLADHELDSVYLIEAYSHVGFCFKRLGNPEEAIPYYNQALKVAVVQADSTEISNQLSHLGGIYVELGDFEKAGDYLNRAYKIDFALNDSVALAYDMVNLGDLMLQLNKHEEAIDYYLAGLREQKTRAGNHNTRVLRLGKLAVAYLMGDELDSALKYNALASQEAIDLNDSLSLARQWITRADILQQKRLPIEAMEIGMQAYSYFKSKAAPKFQIAAGQTLVSIYRDQNAFGQALRILNEITYVAAQHQLLRDLGEAHLRRTEVLERLSRPQEALNALRSYQSVRDTLQKNEQARTILLLDREYQTAQKEQEIALLKAKDELQQYQLEQRRATIVLLAIVFSVLLISGVSLYLINRRRSQLKTDLLSSEVTELRMRLKGFLELQPEEIGVVKAQINQTLNEPLSEREFEILNLALSEKSNPQIAEEIFLSVHTVKFHLRNVYSKLGVSNRKEALKYAVNITSKAG